MPSRRSLRRTSVCWVWLEDLVGLNAATITPLRTPLSWCVVSLPVSAWSEEEVCYVRY
jgi:hypothetical protein